MIISESRLAASIEPDWWELPEDTQVSVVEKDEFIERYTQLLELGDTVLKTQITIERLPEPVTLMTVSPYGNEDRRQAAERMNEAMDKVGVNLPHLEPTVARGPISRERAERQVQSMLEKQAKGEQYSSSNRLMKAFQIGRFLLGKSSLYDPLFYASDYFPDILDFINTSPRQVIVRKESEEAFIKTVSL